jgi:outer membrane protein, multidrug efflux system
VPTGIPSSILKQRPDIQRVDFEMNALLNEIGIAKTAYLPSFQFTASTGFEALKANQLFKWKNHIWFIGTNMALDLLDAGKKASEVSLAKARFFEASSKYISTVLSAIKEVENSLQTIIGEQKRLTFAKKQEMEYQEAANRIASTLKSGVSSYQPYLLAESSAIQAKRSVIDEQFTLQVATLSLLKSLGGTWENTIAH